MYYLHMAETSALEQEIRQQPAVLASRRAPTAGSIEQSTRLITDPSVTHLAVAARGSSANAARYAQHLFGAALNLGVYPAAPSLYQQAEGPALSGAGVLGISQSGQSPDVVGVLEAARRQGRPTIAITNDPDSPMAQAADVVVPLLAGEERSVAATKTFTATLQSLVQICAHLVDGEFRQGLDQLPELMTTCIDRAMASADEMVELLASPATGGSFLTAVGRGTGGATASESALKIREVAGVRAESYSLPDLLHGPIAANRSGSSLWIVASPSYPPSYWDELASRMRSQGVRVTALVPEGTPSLTADLVCRLPQGLPAWLFDLLAVVYGQVAALALGESLGVDVDHPRGLSKVTRTA
jgi:glucosamine--fructose-6-phosphate aminotransferase (isomerizing)